MAPRVSSHLGPAVRAEHERVDGRGYPDGLAEDVGVTLVPVGQPRSVERSLECPQVRRLPHRVRHPTPTVVE